MKGQLYRRSPEALSAEVGDDIVALNVTAGQCYGMEQVTAHVWKLIEEPTGLDAICRTLVDRYEVDPERCRKEVSGVLEQMRREGLVELIGG